MKIQFQKKYKKKIRTFYIRKKLCTLIKNNNDITTFNTHFKNKVSDKFNLQNDLKKVGVVNQTTMLASETKEIIEIFTKTFQEIHKKERVDEYIINTRDTLCYATNENQESTLSLLKNDVDLAIVVGGYNSSNTTHLVELIMKKTNTFFINSVDNILLNNSIKHFDIKNKREVITKNFLPLKKCDIIITSGASCPDLIIENVIRKICEMKKEEFNYIDWLTSLKETYKV